MKTKIERVKWNGADVYEIREYLKKFTKRNSIKAKSLDRFKGTSFYKIKFGHTLVLEKVNNIPELSVSVYNGSLSYVGKRCVIKKGENLDLFVKDILSKLVKLKR